jgi:hypothetical protein
MRSLDPLPLLSRVASVPAVVRTAEEGNAVAAAEFTAVGGLLDLKERRLVADPRVYFRALAADPGVFGH